MCSKRRIKKCLPEIIDSNGVLSYLTLSNGTVAGLALLVPMSPVFGEPILLPVNHCLTDIAALRQKSTTKVIENNKTVMKPICIEEELYNNAPFEFVGITAGAQLYFALGSLEKKRNHSKMRGFSKILICLVFCKPRGLFTFIWMLSTRIPFANSITSSFQT